MVMILAGLAPGLATDPLSIVLQFGAFGVLCLLVLHVFKHTIPRLASQFEKAIAALTKTFRDESTEQRRVFTEELRIQRADFKDFLMQQHQQIDKLTDSIGELTTRIEERLAG